VTHGESFGIHSILDQRDAVAEGLTVKIGVLFLGGSVVSQPKL
jgi:hypothetical protein